MTAPQAIPFAAEGPRPLIRSTPAAALYPIEALGPLRDVAEAIQGRTQAPVEIPAASALAVASLAVQGFADVQTLNDFAPVSLYLLTIALSGERKSSCDRPLMKPLRDHERVEAETYSNAHKKWLLDREVYDEEKKAIMRGFGSANDGKRLDAEVDLAALGDSPDGPVLSYRTASEPTLEGLFRAFQEGQSSLGLFSDEAGQFLGGFGMSADNRTKTLGGLNSIWDGAAIQRTRAGDGVYRLEGRRLALHLMAQPIVMHAFLSDPIASGLGFLPRCLICEPESKIGIRLSKNERHNDAALEDFARRLEAILRREMPTWDDGRSLKPRPLNLSLDARELLRKFSDAVETEQAPSQRLAHITGAASKAAEQAARIAGVLTLWADLDAPEVNAKTMSWGIELAQFYLGEAARLASVAMVSEDIARAEALRKWLLETWTYPEIISSEIVQFGPNRLREATKVHAAAALLERYGWLVALPEGSNVRGAARKHAWRIVRAVG